MDYRLLGLDPSKVTEHEDGTISYDGDVSWGSKDFTQFPLKFKTVTGNFYCSECTSLTSLQGAPSNVKEDFYCRACTSLTSLEGAPTKVGRDFNCSGCTSLTSLEGLGKFREIKLEGSWINYDAFIKACAELKDLSILVHKVITQDYSIFPSWLLINMLKAAQ